MDVNKLKDQLVCQIASCEKVKGIGQTGDINAPLVSGQSDIDMFVLCTEVPSVEERRQLYAPLESSCTSLEMGVCQGGIWGHGDVLIIAGIDVMPMYFTTGQMESHLDSILAGEHLGKEGGFYPVGRLASVETLNVLYEEAAAWSSLIDKVKRHPPSLFEKLFNYHIRRVLDDEELGRVLLRREVLFYHQVLEEALDHLLQALYALNHAYFPSRKRTLTHIERFEKKPPHCRERLLQIIREASQEETIPQSVQELTRLTNEIKQLSHNPQ